ncbi:MAG: DUF2974 domain-containing protein [Treponema sp.]|nr:DUF2974 domain-containing protein [Candidatus Treponema caballi]
MADLFDYLYWRGDLSFTDAPLSDADALILCQLAYIDYTDAVPASFFQNGPTLAEAMETLTELECTGSAFYKRFFTEQTKELLLVAGQTLRFGALRVSGCRHIIDMEKEEQFSALTFMLPDNSSFLAYSGTDAMLVGWQENFNMGWKNIVPAQTDALCYLNDAAAGLSGSIRAGGHSKGGNLALYAAAHAPSEVQARLAGIWNFDGPGFKADFFDSAGYRAVSGRIRNFKPHLSVVGMLFTNSCRYTVVKSTGKGMFQHYPLNWQVEPRGLETLPELDETSLKIGQAANGWLNELETEQKRVFVETVFGILRQSSAETGAELASNWKVTLPNMLKALFLLDGKTRASVRRTLRCLVKHAAGKKTRVTDRRSSSGTEYGGLSPSRGRTHPRIRQYSFPPDASGGFRHSA